jgi:transposase
MAAGPLSICTASTAAELRHKARAEGNRRASMRMLAIANAIEGMERVEAARLADMSGQALCDAIKRYNAEGLGGLYDLPKPGRPRRLAAEQERELVEIVVAGPDVETAGLSAYTRDDLVRLVGERWNVTYHPGSIGRALRRLGLSRQKARPSHPKKDPAAAAAFKKSPGNAERNCRYT